MLSTTQYGLGRIDMIEQAIVLSYDHLANSGPNRFPFIALRYRGDVLDRMLTKKSKNKNTATKCVFFCC